MPTRKTTPDLLGATRTQEATGSSSVPAVRANLSSQSRYLLPQNLPGALEYLDDSQVDALLEAVTNEAQRRGRPLRGRAKNAGTGGAVSLTKGKLNAVRAAFKAGVKPSAIARQFGISHSDVEKRLLPTSGNEIFGLIHGVRWPGGRLVSACSGSSDLLS